MATLISCRYCRAEFARVALADGSAALLCIECEVTQFEHRRDARFRVVVANPNLAKRPHARKRTRIKTAHSA